MAGQTVQIPANAAVTVTGGGGFRNPRCNVAAGSLYPVTSFHTKGRALDLHPVPISGANGRRTRLDPHKILYPALARAAAMRGTAIAEQGATPVPVGCCGTCGVSKKGTSLCEDHIHVQW